MCGESGLSPLQAGAGVTVRGNYGTQRSLEAKIISRSYYIINYKPFGGLIAPNEGDLGTLSKKICRHRKRQQRDHESRDARSHLQG